ncbi:nicotinate-nucleotide adenylyltransferase [bacterium (Candidatus Blackallbacteria) CG17_big_fil_post_rev_8_21_14_2_50_48_46]|uniref:Nicotinate-nucleotide adenylyltransferase n=1 Tax=bacterium (Candidatus Blackallbacteria) CG17_big_fil_post_rev_8_21_14_2_50_48_46 TaxID=2014261 RepID=A0A2M7GAK0_9BACT|nr:MAG: nicotinate-nucleotide adenylyltransferase [bacterium (Candidatus Blackallbacteria) CG18_big_fil_WC_8_21_14_2_50_49_26]PIW19183.1 MAG: nicotinate-nucleotide adenylyltransferase [bacterium (Candidatus Blackallbacteria) CG17_big_fil_post_rev_8_21_14_2_50_48_46]PIW45467.1 MAG: nicotinate-nucleotide adenylyltransferase [bacterium (Candidatus Blackallbacteria) CG13_big_fil_rev_8_21_14_2_50_49_14]
MTSQELLNTHQKALRINLEPIRYGSFAEIGAGQEVVRWFFTVGGAAGTIAKSISAYDMKVSDAIYGRTKRYVCRERLESMLDYEHKLNLERLRDERGDNTAFFTFADTVAARSFKGTNECHGWMGVRYQAHPRDEDSQIILHVRMLDKENTLQQEALGIVGVNLLYGAFFLHHRPDDLIRSLKDNLSPGRIVIDMIEFSGIEFRNVDNRLMSLRLVQEGLANAAVFAADGQVLQPSEFFYKKPILMERGSFRPVRKVHLDLMEAAWDKFKQEPGVETDKVIRVMEVTMHHLTASGGLEPREFLARADALNACGFHVLISNYFEYYRLAAYLARFSKKSIALAMGIRSLQTLFDEQYYTHLEGGILESLGRLFKNDLKLYIYPAKDPDSGAVLTLDSLEIAPGLDKLFGYLVDKGLIVYLDNYNPDCLTDYSRNLLHQIETHQSGWEEKVPEQVVKLIKERHYFGYHPHEDEED